jgi:hypothetical protein
MSKVSLSQVPEDLAKQLSKKSYPILLREITSRNLLSLRRARIIWLCHPEDIDRMIWIMSQKTANSSLK